MNIVNVQVIFTLVLVTESSDWSEHSLHLNYKLRQIARTCCVCHFRGWGCSFVYVFVRGVICRRKFSLESSFIKMSFENGRNVWKFSLKTFISTNATHTIGSRYSKHINKKVMDIYFVLFYIVYTLTNHDFYSQFLI